MGTRSGKYGWWEIVLMPLCDNELLHHSGKIDKKNLPKMQEPKWPSSYPGHLVLQNPVNSPSG